MKQKRNEVLHSGSLPHLVRFLHMRHREGDADRADDHPQRLHPHVRPVHTGVREERAQRQHHAERYRKARTGKQTTAAT